MSENGHGIPHDAAYAFILNHCREFITLINHQYVYELANKSYCEALEKRPGDVIGRTVSEIWGEERFSSSIKIYLDRCFLGETVSYLEKFQFGAEKRYVNVSYYPYRREDGTVSHALVTSHDITHLGELEGMLMNYEYRDPPTGLFNRKSLEILLEVELMKAQRGPGSEHCALLFVGIENLAEISRRHGYDIGDRVLESTGMKVQESVRNSDYVFRFQGNELAVILSQVASERDVAKISAKISQAVSTPYGFRDADIIPVCRVGAAIQPDDGETVEGLIRNAASALADAVRDGEIFRRFDSVQNKQVSHRLSMESRLRHALSAYRSRRRRNRGRGGAHPLESSRSRNRPACGVPADRSGIRNDGGNQPLDALRRSAPDRAHLRTIPHLSYR